MKEILTDSFIEFIDKYIENIFPNLPLGDAEIPSYLYQSFESAFDEKDKPKYTHVINEIGDYLKKHIGLIDYFIPISFYETRIEKEAGLFEPQSDTTGNIKICTEGMNTNAIIATLCHELSHAFQHIKLHRQFDDNDIKKTEQFTDALTYYLGFAKYIIAGYWFFTDGCRHELGYIGEYDFNRINKLVCSRLKILELSRKEIIKLNDNYQTMQMYCEYVSSLHDYLNKNGVSFETQELNCFIDFKQKYNERLNHFKTSISSSIDAYISLKAKTFEIENVISCLLSDYQKIIAIYNEKKEWLDNLNLIVRNNGLIRDTSNNNVVFAYLLEEWWINLEEPFTLANLIEIDNKIGYVRNFIKGAYEKTVNLTKKAWVESLKNVQKCGIEGKHGTAILFEMPEKDFIPGNAMYAALVLNHEKPFFVTLIHSATKNLYINEIVYKNDLGERAKKSVSNVELNSLSSFDDFRSFVEKTVTINIRKQFDEEDRSGKSEEFHIYK